ncbi:MAG: DUF3750 domain-containing protein [Bacteroidota bacterium]
MNTQDAILTVYASPLPIPFSLAVHTWIEINENGRTTRWEVWQHANLTPHAYGHVHKNLFKTGRGIRVFYLGRKKFKPRIIASLSLPAGISEKIEHLIPVFPAAGTYRYVPGPNSNTFTAWVIKKLNLEGSVQLPWRAIGKNYVKNLT